uniref:Uncharacterized protein n=2 Tax=Oryza punctata TaxID=4537 RepID=A0A1V1H0S3_ORYPU|nr:hypothetical protein [Oryza punctata]
MEFFFPQTLTLIIFFAKSLEPQLSDSPSGLLLLRCNLLHLATTRQLIASLRAIYDTMEEFVDAGFTPLPSDEFLKMIRDVRDAGETMAADSLDQIDASLAALLASLSQEDDDNGEDETQVQISRL